MLSSTNTFSRSSEWVFMIDSFYILKNLEASSLNDFFLTMELHESNLQVWQ